MGIPENDIKWGLLNKHLLEYSENNDWGLYRNTRFEMAEILRKEMKLRGALKTYLEVCYFDLNGPMNRGGTDDPEILKEFPVFDPKSAFIAPGIIDRVKIISKKLRMNLNQIKEIFISHNEKLWRNLKLPISPEKAWKDLELEIRKTSTKKMHE